MEYGYRSARRLVKDEDVKMRCPYCNSPRVVKSGYNQRMSKINGAYHVKEKIQKYYCNDCHRRTQYPVIKDENTVSL